MNQAQAAAKLEKGYKSAGGSTAIPWEQIVQILLSIFQGCSTAQAKQTAKSHPVITAGILAGKLAEEMPSLKPKDRTTVAEQAVVLFNATSTKDVDSLRQ